MVDIDPEARIVAMIPASADGRLLLASTSGHGFVAQMSEVVAETRKGRNVVNLKPKAALAIVRPIGAQDDSVAVRSEEHTSELQSLMRTSYAVFCLKKKTPQTHQQTNYRHTQHKNTTQKP